MTSPKLWIWSDGDRELLADAIAGASRRSAETLASTLPQEPSDLQRATTLHRQLRRRVDIFGEDNLFQDAGWTMLLELFIAHEQETRLSATSACDGAGIPHTTGLRWLAGFELKGLVMCERDKADGRRRIVELTFKGLAMMRLATT
jgi:DNA-binding MarR family transcriptional regulator